MNEPSAKAFSTIDASASASIQRIEDKRLLLKRVVAITRAIQRMQEGFTAVLLLGETTADLPVDALRFFRALSDGIRHQPSQTIKLYLERIEQLLEEEFHRVLELSQIDTEAIDDSDPVGGASLSEEMLEFLREFKRRAQTAVSLKVLLQERGIGVPATVIPVPVKEIRARLSELDCQESQQRNKLRQQIGSMKSDLEAVIRSSAYSEQMKSVFGHVIEGLEKDIEALETGNQLDALELSFEAVEAEQSLSRAIVESPSAEEEAEAPLAETPEPEAPVQTEQKTEPLPPAKNSSHETQPKGFFQLFVYWLNSPWSVSWRQLKKRS